MQTSRIGAEPKPTWRQVPGEVRRQTADLLGANVERAMRIWGGYGPSATFRLFLADGRRVVFKGVCESPNEFLLRAFDAEARVYRELGEILLGRWAPKFHGDVEHADWRALLLEDVGSAQVPPWTPRYSALALRDFAEFHKSTLARTDIPEWVPRTDHLELASSWRDIAAQPDGVMNVAGLAGRQQPEAQDWLHKHLESLTTTALQLRDVEQPHALLHFDARSDNLRIQPGGRLRLFDWPFACVAPPEMDLVELAQSITTEGGPSPERCVDWYRERLAIREDALVSSVAALAGFFAARAWQPTIPGVPRVRSFQRRQLRTTLAWSARQLGLAEPTWLAAIPD